MSLEILIPPKLIWHNLFFQIDNEDEEEEQKEERNSQLHDFFHTIAGDNFEIDAFELQGVLTQVFQNGKKKMLSMQLCII